MQSLSQPSKYQDIDSDYLGLYKKNTEKLEELEERVEKQKNTMQYGENSGYWNGPDKKGNLRNLSNSMGYGGDGSTSNNRSNINNNPNYYSLSNGGLNNEENNYFHWKDEERFKNSLLGTGTKWEDGEGGEVGGELDKLDRKLFDMLERREDRGLVLSSEELMKQMSKPWEYQSSSWEF